MLLNVCIKIHMWWVLIRVCYLTCWLRHTNDTLVNVSDIASVYHLQGYFFNWNRVLCVTGWPLSTNVSHTPIGCMYIFGKKRDISASICSYYLKNTRVGLFMIIIYNTCISGAEDLNDFGILFLCSFGSFIYVS